MRGGTAEPHHPFAVPAFHSLADFDFNYLCGGSIRGRRAAYPVAGVRETGNQSIITALSFLSCLRYLYLVRSPLVSVLEEDYLTVLYGHLTYIPYAVLAAMTFPGCFLRIVSTGNDQVATCDCGTSGRQSVTVAISASAVVYVLLLIL